jgi:hypothetical protein
MVGPFRGTEALANGALTRAQLRWNHRALYPDIYVHNAVDVTLLVRIRAAWLWSRGRAVIAGRAAAALHGALWVDDAVPIELIWKCARPPTGIIVRNERIDADEIVHIGGMPVTSPTRTGLDLARHLTPELTAVTHLDALARATGVQATAALELAQRYPGARGVAEARRVLPLLDAGAQSPKETWVRLLLMAAGFPRPQTQIPITDGYNTAYVDMGWEDDMIGVDYDGAQHLVDRARYVHDIGRNELIAGQGWIVRHVVAEHSRRFIIHRVSEAFRQRGIARPDCA